MGSRPVTFMLHQDTALNAQEKRVLLETARYSILDAAQKENPIGRLRAIEIAILSLLKVELDRL